MESYSYQNGAQKEQDFQKLAQTIGTSIQKITQNVSSMKRMVNQIGTHQDSPDLRKQLHSIQHYTQQLVKDTNGCIKELNAIPASVSQSEQRQRKMQKERLQDEFTSALNMFQTVQRSTASKEKEQVNKAKAQAYGGEPYIPGYKKDQQLIELQDSGARQQLQIQEEEDLRSLQAQEQSIRQLESDINDVNQIFKELGALVHEQGETIDSIEASVERTENYVRTGATQLREASTLKNKIRKKKLILAGIGAIILAVIILIIVWQTN
ncbi:syntaxin-12 [Aethina tumida]|uniref:syntaxin-12 n=1 Tax=Aethina tumida TaxID=116153 RepID=UPI00096B6799|nr:syntaxin-12 [Aethina tumida]XP_019874146.1 syntaxin-12 [Aethina tumida]